MTLKDTAQLLKCLFENTLQHTPCKRVPNTAEICTKAFLSRFFQHSEMNLVVFRSEILRLYVDILTVDDKYSCHYSENFGQPIQMQWSKKQKVFSDFLLPSWNLHKSLNILKKRWRSLPKYLQFSRLWKMFLLKCLKGPFWDQSLRVNLLTGPKHFWNQQWIEFEFVSLTEIWNLRTVCWHIDCRLQVYSSLQWEFGAATSNKII